MRFLVVIAILAVLCDACAAIKVAFITDTHLGENCGFPPDLTSAGCKPVRNLEGSVAKVNTLDPQPDAVFISGDITASALPEEFAKVCPLAVCYMLYRLQIPRSTHPPLPHEGPRDPVRAESALVPSAR